MAKVKLLKQRTLGNSLAVQWLGLGAFTAVAQVQSLVRELRSRKPHSTAKNKQTSKQTNRGPSTLLYLITSSFLQVLVFSPLSEEAKQDLC